MQEVILRSCPTKYADMLEQPITIEELFSALRPGAKHKTPGIDGFCLEFYIANWDTIKEDLLELMNQMFPHKNITPQQKHGIIVCLSESNGDRTSNGYRPIFLLTTEYKLLARIMARRLRHVLKDHLLTSQFCGVPGNSILEAASLVWDTHCLLTDIRINPLCTYPRFPTRLWSYHPSQPLSNLTPIWHHRMVHREATALYENATASVQFNGTLGGPYQSKVQCGRVVH